MNQYPIIKERMWFKLPYLITGYVLLLILKYHPYHYFVFIVLETHKIIIILFIALPFPHFLVTSFYRLLAVLGVVSNEKPP